MEQNKKIVYVMGDLTYPNGMSRVITQKVNYLAEQSNFEVYAVLTENADKPFYFPLSTKVKYVNFNINFEVLNSLPIQKKIIPFYIKQKRYRKLFTKYLMEIRPDVTVSILRREINFINDIPDGSRKIGEIHFTRANYRLFNKKYLPKIVNNFVTSVWRGQMDKQIKRLYKCVILTNEDKKNWEGFNNIEVIPNPISLFPTIHSNCKNKTVIAAGRYSPEKGYDRLIKAWKEVNQRHPDWTLNIYGAGEREGYQNLAHQLGIETTINCNSPVKDIYAKYAESSIFAITSHHEGFGLVIAEAMATGVPPVAFAFHCGPRDIITDGVDGMIVEEGNITKLADAICYLIEHEDIRCKMGQEGIKSAERYREERIMERWIKLFNE